MDANNSKQLYARRVLLITGLFPTIPCWIVYLSATFQEKTTLSLTFGLVFATLLNSVIAYPFRKKNFDWIYTQRPVFGSFVSMMVHMAAGFISLVTPFGIYFLAQGDAGNALLCVLFAAVAMLIALPGAIVGFYANAHALIYIAQNSFTLKSKQD
ncbi:MAG: hypothetical protein JNM24_14100 [Bdellovibrionaceae bacterium]|nr:hypothetical protein [Pseudobdellovibrionaceae bacterium]